MWRTILLFVVGMFCTALLSAAISVYLFHDVDKDMVGRWNEAFVGLLGETILFTLVIGFGVGLLTWIGRLVFRLRGYPARARLSLLLGIGVSVVQYPWDFAARAAVPRFADMFLYLYFVVAVVVCSVVMVCDGLRQMKWLRS